MSSSLSSLYFCVAVVGRAYDSSISSSPVLFIDAFTIFIVDGGNGGNPNYEARVTPLYTTNLGFPR